MCGINEVKDSRSTAIVSDGDCAGRAAPYGRCECPASNGTRNSMALHEVCCSWGPRCTAALDNTIRCTDTPPGETSPFLSITSPRDRKSLRPTLSSMLRHEMVNHVMQMRRTSARMKHARHIITTAQVEVRMGFLLLGESIGVLTPEAKMGEGSNGRGPKTDIE